MALNAPVPKCVKVDSSASNIPTTPSLAAGSLVFQNLMVNPGNQPVPYSHLQVINSIAGAIKLIFVEAGSPVPQANSTQGVYVAGESSVWLDGVSILDDVYMISDTGSALSSGIVRINIW